MQNEMSYENIIAYAGEFIVGSSAEDYPMNQIRHTAAARIARKDISKIMRECFGTSTTELQRCNLDELTCYRCHIAGHSRLNCNYMVKITQPGGFDDDGSYSRYTDSSSIIEDDNGFDKLNNYDSVAEKFDDVGNSYSRYDSGGSIGEGDNEFNKLND
jgi:hypothetical protein